MDMVLDFVGLYVVAMVTMPQMYPLSAQLWSLADGITWEEKNERQIAVVGEECQGKHTKKTFISERLKLRPAPSSQVSETVVETVYLAVLYIC